MKIVIDERGLAVPLVLVIMVVLMLLGTTLLQYSVSDALQVSRDEKRMQAYYIARSGAEAIAEWIIKHPGEAIDLINAPKSDPASLGRGTFEVDVAGDTDNISIKSTGKVNDVNQSVTLTLKRMDIFKKWALFSASSEDNIVINSGSAGIEGDLGANAGITINKNVEFDWEKYGIYPYSNIFYPPASFPTGLEYKGSIPDENGKGNKQNTDEKPISSNGMYDRINLQGNDELTFRMDNNDLKIMVDTFNVSGNGIIKLA
jgi:Tfp pilus assembly protein PilX